MLWVGFVTAAGTVPQLRNACPLVWTGPVVGGVARRAIRLEGWERPTHDLRVVGMTIRATELDAMIAGISCRLMHEDQRSPEIPAMTIVALQLCREVVNRFAGRRRAVVTT